MPAAGPSLSHTAVASSVAAVATATVAADSATTATALSDNARRRPSIVVDARRVEWCAFYVRLGLFFSFVFIVATAAPHLRCNVSRTRRSRGRSVQNIFSSPTPVYDVSFA